MKAILIVLGSMTVLAFVTVQLFAMGEQKNTETYPYVINKKYETFEVRTYEARLFTSVKLSTGSYKEGSGRGFSILASYIFGGNKSNEKIAMTSPVAMSLEDSMTMMFMVPKEYSRDLLPEPNQPDIQFQEVPSKKVAAITFGGWASDERIETYKNQLISALDQEGIEYTNKFFFLGYNPPFEVVNRRNEVIVELK